MDKISLRQLRAFTTVVEKGSLMAAGRHLLLSQATLSEAIGALEGKLRQKLFDRANRRLQLTPFGHVFLEDACALLAQSEALYRKHADRSLLLCGASVTVGNYILPPYLISLAQARPELRIDLTVRNTQEIIRLVQERKVQVGIVEGQVDNVDLDTIAWRDDELTIFAAVGHPLLRGATAQELADAEWILREIGSGTRESFDAAAKAWPCEPRVIITAGGNEFIKRAVANGSRLSCLSRAAIAVEIARGELAIVPTTIKPMLRTLTILRRRDAARDLIVEDLIDALSRDSIGEVASGPSLSFHS